MNNELFVGPAGWSYDDWQGIVYPPGKKDRRLALVADLFDTIEINSSFYRSPTPRSSESWLRVVESKPRFRFTAKLVRVFTHDHPRTWTVAARDEFRDGMAPLLESGRLGAVLVQFPWSFAVTQDNVRRLERIRKAFPELPLVVEVRHRSWLHTAALERLRGLNYSICNVDLPESSTSVPAGSVVTGPIGYLRLHGRNSAKWFDRTAQVHEKFDYLYSDAELVDLVEHARQLRAATAVTYVVMNNHFAGQGPANAFEFEAALTGQSRPIPPSLVARYPRLAAVAPAAPEGQKPERNVGDG